MESELGSHSNSSDGVFSIGATAFVLTLRGTTWQLLTGAIRLSDRLLFRCEELGWRPLVHVDEGLSLTAASFTSSREAVR